MKNKFNIGNKVKILTDKPQFAPINKGTIGFIKRVQITYCEVSFDEKWFNDGFKHYTN